MFFNIYFHPPPNSRCAPPPSIPSDMPSRAEPKITTAPFIIPAAKTRDRLRCRKKNTVNLLQPTQLISLESCLRSAYICRMKWLSAVGLCVLCVLCVLTSLVAPAESQPVVIVNGPPIVAFFAPAARSQNSADANEALADFQFYAKNIREPLKNDGIAFHELYTHSFRLRDSKRLITFTPVKVNVGYYLVAPAKKPRIEYGVMTDSDLLQLAKEYFGVSVQ
jgi:hypothetical protein